MTQPWKTITFTENHSLTSCPNLKHSSSLPSISYNLYSCHAVRLYPLCHMPHFRSIKTQSKSFPSDKNCLRNCLTIKSWSTEPFPLLKPHRSHFLPFYKTLIIRQIHTLTSFNQSIPSSYEDGIAKFLCHSCSWVLLNAGILIFTPQLIVLPFEALFTVSSNLLPSKTLCCTSVLAYLS